MLENNRTAIFTTLLIFLGLCILLEVSVIGSTLANLDSSLDLLQNKALARKLFRLIIKLVLDGFAIVLAWKLFKDIDRPTLIVFAILFSSSLLTIIFR
jgi:hypothetical protein